MIDKCLRTTVYIHVNRPNVMKLKMHTRQKQDRLKIKNRGIEIDFMICFL